MTVVAFENVLASVNTDPASKTAGIDAMDTVFFDLANAVYSTNRVEVPVFIKTDDQVFALDFSTQFDLTKLTYDSLINLTPSLSPLAWYNTSDSTLRMTSFSLNQLNNNTPLVHVRFITSAGQTLSESDFDIKNVLLNGEACSWYIIDPMNTTITEFEAEKNATILYPNPCTGSFNVDLPFPSELSVTSINGQLVYDQVSLERGQHNIPVDGMQSGVYFVEVVNEYFSVTRKVVVRN
jgi:hypothetical protein